VVRIARQEVRHRQDAQGHERLALAGPGVVSDTELHPAAQHALFGGHGRPA
jgi:hypothetical protein